MTESLKYSLTESADETFTSFQKSFEDEIGQKRRTRSQGSKTKVMWIKEILIEYDGQLKTDGHYIAFQITTNEESDMVNISDKDCFFKFKKICNLATNGLELQDTVWKIPVNKPYIKKDVYFGIKTKTGAVATLNVEIVFEYKYISDWVLSRMIARRA